MPAPPNNEVVDETCYLAKLQGLKSKLTKRKHIPFYIATGAQDSPKRAREGPKKPNNGPKMAPRWPRITPRGPKMAPKSPKMAPRWPKMAPRWPQTRPRRNARSVNNYPSKASLIAGIRICLPDSILDSIYELKGTFESRRYGCC